MPACGRHCDIARATHTLPYYYQLEHLVYVGLLAVTGQDGTVLGSWTGDWAGGKRHPSHPPSFLPPLSPMHTMTAWRGLCIFVDIVGGIHVVAFGGVYFSTTPAAIAYWAVRAFTT